MVDDALAGKIDLIIVKSISRFARNTVDALKTIRTIRDLKAKGIKSENLSKIERVRNGDNSK